MKHLTNFIKSLENKCKDLLDELQELKMRAYALEEENEKLRKELTEIFRINIEETQRKKPLQKAENRGEGYDNLARLYNEGFHVCPMHFGQSRVGSDCLFCMGLLKKD